MRYIKYFKSNNNIDSICKRYGIENYTINPDGSIDVDDDVYLNNKDLTKLPLQFRNVNGVFNCSYNQLTSLEGCPNVSGDFYCSHNQLTSLSGGPNDISGYFICTNNKLKSLEGGPNYVGDDYYCNDNQLTSLKGAPKRVDIFDCSYNQLETLEYMPLIINGYFRCSKNKLTNLISLKSDIKGSIYLDNNPLPEEILDNLDLIKEILKWQNDYSIWNRNGTLNKENFQELIDDL